MSPELALCLTVRPTLAWLGELGIRDDPRAAVMLLAMAGQESGWKHRRQMGSGPARGLWQFERIAVAEVLRHPLTRPRAEAVCGALLVAPTADAAHTALELNDPLACAFARLLLLPDPAPLPGEQEAGWGYYLRRWKPGQPHHATWAGHWAAAIGAVSAPPHGKDA